jgi:hypothetical protein
MEQSSLIERLTVTELVEKFATLYGTRRLITVLNSPPLVTA